MARARKSDAFEVVYGAVIGGLMASFVAVAVFSVFMDNNTGNPPLFAVVVGLVSAAGFLAAGLLGTKSVPWLGTSFLFAAGFSGLWSVALSLSVEQKWFTVLALGAVIAAGVWLGAGRFGGAAADAADAVGDGGVLDAKDPSEVDGAADRR
jgi:FtsH-binding integral membrane protein